MFHRLKCREETSEVPHLEHSTVWCWNVGTSQNRPQIPGKFWHEVMEKDGEGSWNDRVKNEVLHNVRLERNIPHTIKRGLPGWSHIAWKLPSKTRYWRKDRRDGKKGKKTEGATGWSYWNERMLEIENGRTRAQCVKTLIWKRLWTFRKTD
jgi:hypothetical protein